MKDSAVGDTRYPIARKGATFAQQQQNPLVLPYCTNKFLQMTTSVLHQAGAYFSLFPTGSVYDSKQARVYEVSMDQIPLLCSVCDIITLLDLARKTTAVLRRWEKDTWGIAG